MGLFDGITGAAGAAGIVSPVLALGMFDTAQQAYFNYINYHLQRDAYNWQKDAQVTTWGREDSSIQRRVADLRAAGLSPVLAAGQGAGSGGIVSVTPPQMQGVPLGEKAMLAMSLLKMEADISKTAAEKEYIELQKSKVPAEIQSMKANSYLTSQKARAEKVNADVVSESGVPGSSVAGKAANDAYGAIKKAKDYIQSGWTQYDNAVGEFRKKLTDKIRSGYEIPKQPYKPDRITGYEKRWQ